MGDIKELYKEFESEVNAVCWSFYTWKNIKKIAANDDKIHHALNGNALSWTIILYSLQSTFFITIGRLFDTDKRSFSVHTFLRKCIENIDQFSKDALRKRRMKGSEADKPSWLDGFIEKSYQPNKEDFLKLKDEVSKRQKQYESIYQPIRHKIFAHKDLKNIKCVDVLFGKAKIDEIQDLLYSLYQIKMIIRELLENGIWEKIGYYPFNEEKFVIKDIAGLLDKIKS
jgi:hypothetical protein